MAGAIPTSAAILAEANAVMPNPTGSKDDRRLALLESIRGSILRERVHSGAWP